MRRINTMVGLSDPMYALFERLRRDADDLFGTRRVEIVPLTFQVRESSEVARARITTPHGVRHVFAKIFKPRPGEVGPQAAAARLRRDYMVTRRVFETMKWARDVRSVEPLACYEDLLGIVTREAPGEPLGLVITKHAAWPTAPSGLEAVDTAVSRTGRWIAAFQRVLPGPESSQVSLDGIRKYIDIRLQRLTTLQKASFSEAHRREMLAYFDRRAAEVASEDLVEVPVHGDIVPSNIIVAPTSVTVLDFGMTSRGSKYLDIARLYTQLDFYAAKPQYRREVIGRLQAAALASFDPGLSVGDPLFEICAVQHVICHLLSHTRQPGPFPSSVYSRHLRRRHRRWLLQRARSVATRSTTSQVVASTAE